MEQASLKIDIKTKSKPKTVDFVIAVSLIGILYYIASILLSINTIFQDDFLWSQFIKYTASIICAITIALAFWFRMPWSVRAFNIVSSILVILTLIVSYAKVVYPQVDLENFSEHLGYSIAVVVGSCVYLGGLLIVNRMVNRFSVVSYFMYPEDSIVGTEEDVFQ